jgi:CRISPR-associated protein Csm1
MTSSHNSSHQEALTVIQQAVSDLANWAGLQLPRPADSSAIEKAREYLQWPSDRTPKPLRLLFDAVKLSEGQNKQYFWLPQIIDDTEPKIPYPHHYETAPKKLGDLTQFDQNDFKNKICESISFLKDSEEDWNNLSLLTLILEKFGSFISYGESDVALIDMAKTTAAVAAAIANYDCEDKLSLIAGDLSGIQNFIYTVSSDGALKSLRARSFYLELVIEEIVQQLLIQLDLPQVNIIYVGGGNLYILASGNTEKVTTVVTSIHKSCNKWLMNSFQGKLFLALDWLAVITKSINQKEFAEYWIKLSKKLAIQKNKKFQEEISNFIKRKSSYEPCNGKNG